jgi:hypothetical protein
MLKRTQSLYAQSEVNWTLHFLQLRRVEVSTRFGTCAVDTTNKGGNAFLILQEGCQWSDKWRIRDARSEGTKQ